MQVCFYQVHRIFLDYLLEASHAILAYGFDKLELRRIISIAMKENIASIRVMEKVGMEFDKFVPYEPGGEDVVWYWFDKRLITRNKRH